MHMIKSLITWVFNSFQPCCYLHWLTIYYFWIIMMYNLNYFHFLDYRFGAGALETKAVRKRVWSPSYLEIVNLMFIVSSAFMLLYLSHLSYDMFKELWTERYLSCISDCDYKVVIDVCRFPKQILLYYGSSVYYKMDQRWCNNVLSSLSIHVCCLSSSSPSMKIETHVWSNPKKSLLGGMVVCLSRIEKGQ